MRPCFDAPKEIYQPFGSILVYRHNGIPADRAACSAPWTTGTVALDGPCLKAAVSRVWAAS